MKTTYLTIGATSLVLASFGVGCGDSSAGTGGSGTTGTMTTTNGSTMTTGTMTTSTGSSDCAPKASCTASDKSCIGLVDNTGLTTFGLRMSEIDFTKPTQLTTGLIKSVVGGAVLPSRVACNLKGTGTFSWLLQFDTLAKTLKMGGARPVADESMGYSFDMESISGMQVAPVTSSTSPDASGNFAQSSGQDLVMPVFLNSDGTSVLVLPIKSARVTMGKLSASQSCIGTYNAAGLQASDGCQGTSAIPTFITGGALDGHITLEDADQVIVSTLNQSLCVVLSGDPAMYGDGGTPVKCKRDGAMTIVYKGDWCHSTNMPADGSCADSSALAANFAASSVKINN